MFVEDMLEAASERLVTIADDVRLIEAAKLLTSGADLVLDIGRERLRATVEQPNCALFLIGAQLQSRSGNVQAVLR